MGTTCGVDIMRMANVLKMQEEKRKEKVEEQKRQQGRSIRVMKPQRNSYIKPTIDDFDILKTLGAGGFGKVYLVSYKSTKETYALKTVKKSIIVGNEDYEITKCERNVLALGLKCPYITNLFCCFQTEASLVFVMEYLSGGDLLFHLYKVTIAIK